MKKLICSVENTPQKSYSPREEYVNLYLENAFGNLGVQMVDSLRPSGITIKITRTSSGDFEVTKVREF